MCFSATASLTSGAAITTLGALTLPMVREPRERPFAALPLLFGIHQILEGIIWLRLDDGQPTSIHDPVVAVWLFMAWTLLPVGVPLAVSWFEPDPRRRQLMLGLAVVGAVVGVYLLALGAIDSTTVWIDQHHLVYGLPVVAWVAAIPYVAATCGSMLASSHRFVVIFGAVLAASAALTVMVASVAFTSVWCFFAAVLSLGLFGHYAIQRDERSAPAELTSS